LKSVALLVAVIRVRVIALSTSRFPELPSWTVGWIWAGLVWANSRLVSSRFVDFRPEAPVAGALAADLFARAAIFPFITILLTATSVDTAADAVGMFVAMQ
jgi:hypothetical protein